MHCSFTDVQFDQALDILFDMYHPVLSCYTHEFDTPRTTIAPASAEEGLLSMKHLFHLPLPTSSLDQVTMKLTSTFLLYSTIALSTTFSSHISELEEISAYLAEYGNLDLWVQSCTDLPYEYRDSLCTRAYSALSKSLEADASPYPSLIIKFYSLRCLLPTSSSVIKPDTFWDQARRFSLVCMKATRDETEMVEKILSESSRLITEVQQKTDKDSFLTAGSFFKLCDYLSKIAVQVFTLVKPIWCIVKFIGREHGRSSNNLCLHILVFCWLNARTPPWNDWPRNR
jgi:separase